jgi:predicted nucleotidyltransferase component of viral defense system
MIPKDFVLEWREYAPWPSDEQVEQDLVISRAVVEIFSNKYLADRLAWRGGTALSKLYFLPAARYSEDIDLVQISSEPIGSTLSALRAVLDPWLGVPKRVLKEGRVNLIYRFASEDIPPRPMKLKIEINSREHFSAFGYTRQAIEVDSRWWKGKAAATSFEVNELLGTKLRALFQRKKGRDLFDLWYALDRQLASPERVLSCFDRYMAESNKSISRAAFEENLANKLSSALFRLDMTPLLRPGIKWDIDEAAALINKELLMNLPGNPWQVPEL